MSKQIPCFICKILVAVQDERAIAKLCSEHDTPENRQLLANTPIHQLLRVLNEGVQAEVEEVKEQLTNENSALSTEISNLRNQLDRIEDRLKSQDTAEQPATETDGGVTVNEYGEVV